MASVAMGASHEREGATMMTAYRVAILGAGGIGGVAAACLQRAGRHNVVLCSRKQVSDLVLEEAGVMTRHSVQCITDPAEAPVVDWVLLCTKAHDTPSVAPWLARL